MGTRVQPTEGISKNFNNAYNTFALEGVIVMSEVPKDVKKEVISSLEENESATSSGLFIVEEGVYVTINDDQIKVLGICNSNDVTYIELEDSELLQSLTFRELIFN
jgi:hypothetical protein